MKTIIIPIFQSFLSRTILRTEAFMKLARDPNLRIIILAPNFKKDFYRTEFGANNVFVEGIDDGLLKRFSTEAGQRAAVFFLPTYYVRNLIKIKFKNKQFIGFISAAFINYIIAPVRIFCLFFRALDTFFIKTNIFEPLLDKYKPDLIFATDIFNPADSCLLLAAKRRGIPTVGNVRSWDCTTNKNFLRVVPEKILSNNEQVKKELVKFHYCPPGIIQAVGFSQYDAYYSLKAISREEFFKKLNLDPAKRLILFAPAGTALTDIDWQFCDIFNKAVKNGSLPGDLQFLIRNHPQSPADFSAIDLGTNFKIEFPGTNVGGGMRATEIDKVAIQHAFDSLVHSEMLISINTSFALDAAILDKPQIMIEFDGYENRPFLESVIRYNKEDNMKKFVETGAPRIVKTKEELIKWINLYLSNPELDSEGRTRAREEVLFKLDGKCGERMADAVLAKLYEKN